MTEPNEAMKAMARRIAEERVPDRSFTTHAMVLAMRELACDAALAAIMETTELAATYAEHRIGVGLTNLAADYRAGDHYALAGDRRG